MLEEYIDKEYQLTVHIFSGVVRAQDLMDAVKKLYESELTPHHLWDLTAADLSSLQGMDLDDLAKLAKQSAPDRKGGRTAIVSSSDLGFGLGRVYQAYAEYSQQRVEIKIFHARDEAEAWIKMATDD